MSSDTRRFVSPPRPYTSFSATTLSGQSQRPGYHQSMPDILFGRELFSNPYLMNNNSIPTPPNSTGDRMFSGPSASTWSSRHQQLPTPPPSSTLPYAQASQLHYRKIEKTANAGKFPIEDQICMI